MIFFCRIFGAIFFLLQIFRISFIFIYRLIVRYKFSILQRSSAANSTPGKLPYTGYETEYMTPDVRLEAVHLPCATRGIPEPNFKIYHHRIYYATRCTDVHDPLATGWLLLVSRSCYRQVISIRPSGGYELAVGPWWKWCFMGIKMECWCSVVKAHHWNVQDAFLNVVRRSLKLF